MKMCLSLKGITFSALVFQNVYVRLTIIQTSPTLRKQILSWLINYVCIHSIVTRYYDGIETRGILFSLSLPLLTFIE